MTDDRTRPARQEPPTSIGDKPKRMSKPKVAMLVMLAGFLIAVAIAASHPWGEPGHSDTDLPVQPLSTGQTAQPSPPQTVFSRGNNDASSGESGVLGSGEPVNRSTRPGGQATQTEPQR